MKKTKVLSVAALAITTLALGLGAVLPVSAQDGTNSTLLEKVAAILDIDDSKLSDAFKEASLEQLGEKVEEGLIEEDRAEQIKEKIESGQFRVGIMGGNGLRGHHMACLTEFLDMKLEDVRSSFQEGKTPAEIISDAGESVDEFKQLAKEKMEERVAKCLANGRIDEEKAEEIQSSFDERIENFLNREFDQSKKLGGGFRGLW